MIEIFEWRDSEAVDEAHNDPAAKASWDKLMAVSTLVPLASLGESSDDYAHFQVMDPKAHGNMPTVVKIVALLPYQGKEEETIKKFKEHDGGSIGYMRLVNAMHTRSFRSITDLYVVCIHPRQ